MVTHYPSAAISCTEVAPNAAEVSQVTTGDTRYAYSDTAMHVLKNIHIGSDQMLFSGFMFKTELFCANYYIWMLAATLSVTHYLFDVNS